MYAREEQGSFYESKITISRQNIRGRGASNLFLPTHPKPQPKKTRVRAKLDFFMLNLKYRTICQKEDLKL